MKICLSDVMQADWNLYDAQQFMLMKIVRTTVERFDCFTFVCPFIRFVIVVICYLLFAIDVNFCCCRCCCCCCYSLFLPYSFLQCAFCFDILLAVVLLRTTHAYNRTLVWLFFVFFSLACVLLFHYKTVNKLNNQHKNPIKRTILYASVSLIYTCFTLPLIHSICFVARLNLHLLWFTIEVTHSLFLIDWPCLAVSFVVCLNWMKWLWNFFKLRSFRVFIYIKPPSSQSEQTAKRMDSFLLNLQTKTRLLYPSISLFLFLSLSFPLILSTSLFSIYLSINTTEIYFYTLSLMSLVIYLFAPRIWWSVYARERSLACANTFRNSWCVFRLV